MDEVTERYETRYCSNCNNPEDAEQEKEHGMPNYCSRCGATMIGTKDEK